MNRLVLRRYAYHLEPPPPRRRGGRAQPVEEMDLIVAFIDGEELRKLVDHDGLPGIPAAYVEPNAHQWAAPPDHPDREGRAVLIDGGCGVAECCGVRASISRDKTTVRWTNLIIGTTTRLNHQFLFDRRLYDRTIAGIPELVAEHCYERQ